jgi:glycosyltransferase involved in cell wall biosynthesis
MHIAAYFHPKHGAQEWDGMYLTVAICTWNRSQLLAQALEQMTHLVIPPTVQWELLVVNNNCTDSTDEVIAAFESRLPIRRVFEPKPGLSNARNAAVTEARGDYILWTDDDTRVHPNWIQVYADAFQRRPAAVIFGGLVLPLFAVPPPPWLERVWHLVAGVYAMRDLGTEPVRFDGGERMPFGANFAVRLDEQRRHLYDPGLGLKPGSNLHGEEIVLVKTLLDAGYEGWWVPQSSVLHYIPVERMTTRYIRQCYSGYGQYLAMKEPPYNGPRLLGKPRWLWRRIVTVEISYRIHRLISGPEIWINHLINAGTAWGMLSADRGLLSADKPAS